jgi:phage terminase small subunit
VAAAIAAARERVFAQLDVTAERVLREIARIAFSDVRELLDEAGAIRPVSYWSPDAAAAVRSVLKRVATTDDGAKARVCTIQFWDKPTALALLFKHLRLDRPQEVSGQLTIRHELP